MAAGYDLVLLLGQSNMSGRAPIDSSGVDLPLATVDQFAASGPNPHAISAAVDPLGHADQGPLGNQLGPGTSFARWYAASLPAGRRLLLIPAAYGGTPLSSTAALGWRRGVTGNLYAQAVAQAKSALAAAGSGARYAAALWVQGEADGNAGTSGAQYQTDLDALIGGLRTDLGASSLPFIIGGMVPAYLGTGTRAAIDAVQRDTPNRLPGTAYAPGPHWQTMGDGNHYNDLGARLLGRSLNTALQSLAGGPAPVADDGNVLMFTDDFHRGDASSLSRTAQGALPWKALSGAWGISGNRALDTGAAASTNHAAVVNSGKADGIITATVDTIGSNAGAGGLIFRATDDQNYLMLTTAGDVYSRQAGAFATLGGGGVTGTDDDELAVTLDGSSIVASINGKTVWSGSSTFNQGATQHGLRSYGATGLRYAGISHRLA